MCHVVGEKNSKSSPRGISKLPIENRNEYSNLLLLCAHHHEEIDKSETYWPIELLHKIKADHELWVEESLAVKIITPEILVYSNIIDNLNSYLKLDSFNWLMNNAIRNVLHRDFVDSLDNIEERKLAIDWPGSNKPLEESIKNVMDAYIDYVTHYLKYAIISEPNFEYYREDTSYKRIFPNPNYQVYSERNMLWIKKNFFLISKYVYYLNIFVVEVRKNFNNLFHIERGKFLVVDDFGMYHGGSSSLFLPNIDDINPQLEKVDSQIAEFETINKDWC